MSISTLEFPSGLSVRRAKSRAKKLVAEGTCQTVTSALDKIAHAEMGMQWHQAMDAITHPKLTDGIVPFMTMADIAAIMDSHPLLNHNGMGYNRGRNETHKQYLERFNQNREQLKNALDEVNKACMFLKFVEKRKSMNTASSSYGLKHQAERYLRATGKINNHYIANGSFICAAIFMGFSIKLVTPDSPNIFINYSKACPIMQWPGLKEKCRMHFTTNSQRNKLEEIERIIGVIQKGRV